MSLCVLTLDGEPALASGYRNGSVRVMRYQDGGWQTDEDKQPKTGNKSLVLSLCVLTLASEPALASVHLDGSVRVMRYQDGGWQADEDKQPKTGNESYVHLLCVLTLDGVPALASGHIDGRVRVIAVSGRRLAGRRRQTAEDRERVTGHVALRADAERRPGPGQQAR